MICKKSLWFKLPCGSNDKLPKEKIDFYFHRLKIKHIPYRCEFCSFTHYITDRKESFNKNFCILLLDLTLGMSTCLWTWIEGLPVDCAAAHMAWDFTHLTPLWVFTLFSTRDRWMCSGKYIPCPQKFEFNVIRSGTVDPRPDSLVIWRFICKFQGENQVSTKFIVTLFL